MSEARDELLEFDHPAISVSRQCFLLGVNRSSIYYSPCGESSLTLELMRLIDAQYTKTPFYGSRRMSAYLRSIGYVVNRKRVSRIMNLMGIQAIFPRKSLSANSRNHKIYPYLLSDVPIIRKDQVWSTDITYIRMHKGFIYLAAVIDWFSRYVLSWKLSNTLDVSFCLEALDEALSFGVPEIFNTDQGVQFTSTKFTGMLESRKIKVSMDSRGRALDNIFVERLWRSVKYEEVYLRDYQSVREAYTGLGRYFLFYNEERFHQSLGYLTPKAVYLGGNS